MKKFVYVIVCLGLLSACVKEPDSSTYNSSEIGVSQTVEYGVIVSSRPVTVANNESGVGGLAGAGMGAAAGSAIGNGSGSIVAAIGGAVIGGVVGHMAEKNMTNHNGIEYTIKQKDQEIIVAQLVDAKNPVIPNGKKVKIIKSGTRTRIVTAN